jgi:type II restriction/modification system DNA methylase subunit YeeA
MEKTQHQDENPADVKAAEKMAKLFDKIKEDNPDDSPEFLHGLNVFLSRLLFCFFAEDTNIFTENQFTSNISSHTQSDGSDLHSYLASLFKVLNTPESDRQGLPDYLKEFPYVNGELFSKEHQMPVFKAKSRKAIIDSGKLDWSSINPDIFGSMFQAVVGETERGSLGMHYTSVPNIMKVIKPLFLDDLREAFDKSIGNNKKLIKLADRLSKIKIFDPACGSGNFLIIAFKELKRLEMEIFKELNSFTFSQVTPSQFYGIEIDDFAHEIAKLSLWLTEHQMNIEFFDEFQRVNPTLPLKKAGNITCANATRIDWEEVCPKEQDDEIYILGNPPYLGARNQDEEQKEDIRRVFRNRKEYKDSDYVSCWLLLASDYIKHSSSGFAFVTTSSISQGEQISFIWPYIYQNNQEIIFAHQAFRWTNNAKKNAGIVCVIIGVYCNDQKRKKYLYSEDSVKFVKGINPYLTEGSNVIVFGRKTNICGLPKMVLGSMARDGGNLIFSDDEYQKLVVDSPKFEKLFRRLYGSKEFIQGQPRWGLWINDEELDFAKKNLEISKRINKVYEFRIASKAKTTNQYAQIPHKFAQRCLCYGTLQSVNT